MVAHLSKSAVIIGILIAIGGWIATHYLSRRRDKENFRLESLKADLKEASNLLELITNCSYIYHTKRRDEILELKLISLLNRLSYRLQNLPVGPDPAANRAVENSLDLFIRFKQAITESHFFDEHIGPLNKDDDILVEINIKSSELEQCLFEIRNHCYKPSSYMIINYWTRFDEQYPPDKQ